MTPDIDTPCIHKGDAAHEHSTDHDHNAGNCNLQASASETNGPHKHLLCKTTPEIPANSVTLVSLSWTTSIGMNKPFTPTSEASQ